MKKALALYALLIKGLISLTLQSHQSEVNSFSVQQFFMCASFHCCAMFKTDNYICSFNCG